MKTIEPFSSAPVMPRLEIFCGELPVFDESDYVYIENDRFTSVPTKVATNTPNPAYHRAGPIADDFSFDQVLPHLTDKAVDYIRDQAKSDKPFFLYFLMTGPHTPIVPAKEFKGRTGLGDYGDFCVEVDAMAGRVFETVRQAGLSTNTLIIFTSDNGCSPSANFPHLESLGHYPSAQFRGLKSGIFDGGHRVPFFVKWPGRIAAGSTNNELICHTDFFATCADLLGQSLPDTAGEDSVSLLPVLLGRPHAEPLREAVVHHSIDGAFAIRQGQWKLELCPGSGGWSKPQPGSPESLKLPPIQLYDLSRDMGETNNVQAEHPEIVARLTKLLEKYVADGRSTPGKPQPNTGPVEIYPKAKSVNPKAKTSSTTPET